MPGYTTVVPGPAASAIANDFWSKQVVMKFATAAARDTALATDKREGMVVYLDDNDRLMFCDGALVWRGVRSMSFQGGSAGSLGIAAVAQTVNTVTVPDQGCAGMLHIALWMLVSRAIPTTDTFEVKVFAGGAQQITQVVTPSAVTAAYVSMSVRAAMPAGGASVVSATVVRTGGTSTADVYADFNVNRLSVMFVPD